MWILMVGLRVVDLGGLIVWLVWFHRQCDQNDDESDGDDFRGPADEPDAPPPTGGRDLHVPLSDADPWPSRRREHGDVAWPPAPPARRRPEPHRAPERSPARISQRG